MKVHGHKPDSGDKGIYKFLIEGAPNPPDLEGIHEDQLIQKQQNIKDKFKQKYEERDKNITKRMKKYEKKYDFINKAPLESVVHITEMTQTDHLMESAKVKSADKMVMLHHFLMALKDLINTLSFKLRAAILMIQS